MDLAAAAQEGRGGLQVLEGVGPHGLPRRLLHPAPVVLLRDALAVTPQVDGQHSEAHLLQVQGQLLQGQAVPARVVHQDRAGRHARGLGREVGRHQPLLVPGGDEHLLAGGLTTRRTRDPRLGDALSLGVGGPRLGVGGWEGGSLGSAAGLRRQEQDGGDQDADELHALEVRRWGVGVTVRVAGNRSCGSRWHVPATAEAGQGPDARLDHPAPQGSRRWRGRLQDRVGRVDRGGRSLRKEEPAVSLVRRSSLATLLAGRKRSDYHQCTRKIPPREGVRGASRGPGRGGLTPARAGAGRRSHLDPVPPRPGPGDSGGPRRGPGPCGSAG